MQVFKGSMDDKRGGPLKPRDSACFCDAAGSGPFGDGSHATALGTRLLDSMGALFRLPHASKVSVHAPDGRTPSGPRSGARAACILRGQAGRWG